MLFSFSDPSYLLLLFLQEDVLGPPPDNDDVVNDFDIEEEVVEVENRLGIVVIKRQPCY